MRNTLKLASIFTLVCSGAQAQDGAVYMAAIPVGTGVASQFDVCQFDYSGSSEFCFSDQVVIPDTEDSVTVVYRAITGPLQDVVNRSGDFVPAPWSDALPSAGDHDFAADPVLSIATDPCLVSLCRDGSVCVSQPEMSPSQYQCEAQSLGLSLLNQEEARMSPITASIRRLQPLSGADAAALLDRQCSDLPPGQACMGSWIRLDDGQVMNIP